MIAEKFVKKWIAKLPSNTKNEFILEFYQMMDEELRDYNEKLKPEIVKTIKNSLS